MVDWLTGRTHATPEKTALIFGDRQWRYADLYSRVSDLASALRSAGVQPGSHVAVLMHNRPEFVFLIHALARLQAILVPLNLRLTGGELLWQVRQADCETLVYETRTGEQMRDLDLEGVNRVAIETLSEAGRRTQPEGLSGGRSGIPTVPLDWEANQAIVFTSGTTGKPKGAMLSYANHFWSATASAYRLGVNPDDRWLLCMPLCHVGGLAIVLRCCLYGMAVVLQEGFNPTGVSAAIDSGEVTIVSLVPTMLHRLIATRRGIPFPKTLRCVLLGGAATPQALLEKSLALGAPVALTYGLTEAASQVATASPQEVARTRKPGARPLLFLDVSIRDKEGRQISQGEIGEIVAAGPMVMRGYYHQPEATQAALQDGELHTGDLGYLDENGNLRVVQRRADLIVSGGENVYPVEVEEVLRAHPAIREACVVGLDDPEWGQQVAAGVVCLPQSRVSVQEVLSFCRERMAGYKIPRRVFFLKSLPRTPSGKVIRGAVKELLVREKIKP